MKKIILILIILAAFLNVNAQTTYYVDKVGTGDTLSTIAEVNALTLSGGDSVLFKRDSVWRESLTVPNSGTSGSPTVFGAYGSGDNPIIDGADVITGMTDGSTAVALASDWDIPLVSESTNSANYTNLRWVIPKDSLGINGNYIRIRLTAPTTEDFVVGGASIGKRDGTTSKFTTTPTRVTFDGGSSTVTVTAGTDKWSDEISYIPDTTTDLLGNIYLDATDPTYYAYSASLDAGNDGYRTTGASDYTMSTTTDFGTVSVGSVRGISGYEIGTTYEAADSVWLASGVDITPNLMYLNDTVGFEQSSIVDCDSTGKWYYNSATNTVYVYSKTDPNSNVELGQRGLLIDIDSHEYITLENLTVQHSNEKSTFGSETWKAGVYMLSGSNLTMSGCIVQKCGFVGVAVGSSSFITMDDNTFLRNGESNKNIGNVRISASTTGISNITFTNNISSYSGGEGLFVLGLSLKTNHIDNVNIHGNTFSNNASTGLYVSILDTVSIYNNTLANNGDSIDASEDYGIAVTSCDNIDIYDNTVTNQIYNKAIEIYSDATTQWGSADNARIFNNIVSGGEGAGISAIQLGDNTMQNLLINNNVVMDAGSNGIYLYHNNTGTASAINVFNNTLVRNKAGLFINPNLGSITTNLKNNLFYESTQIEVDLWYNTSGLTFSNNLYYRASGDIVSYNYVNYTIATISTIDAAAQTTDPLFTDAANGDFSLQSGSPAINNGIDVGITEDILGNPIPTNGGYDIGAYEYIPPIVYKIMQFTSSGGIGVNKETGQIAIQKQ